MNNSKQKPAYRVIQGSRATPKDNRQADDPPSNVATDTHYASLNTQRGKSAARLRYWWDKRERELGLTRVMAAVHLGESSPESIERYLSGESPLTLKTTLRFSRLLNVRPWDLVPGLYELLGFIEEQCQSEYEMHQANHQHLTLTILQQVHEGIQQEVDDTNTGEFSEMKRLIMTPVTRYIQRASANALAPASNPKAAEHSRPMIDHPTLSPTNKQSAH